MAESLPALSSDHRIGDQVYAVTVRLCAAVLQPHSSGERDELSEMLVESSNRSMPAWRGSKVSRSLDRFSGCEEVETDPAGRSGKADTVSWRPPSSGIVLKHQIGNCHG